MENIEQMQKKVDDLEFSLGREERKNKYLNRELSELKVTRKKKNIAVAAIISIISIAVGAQTASVMKDLAKINEGKRLIENHVYEECLDGFGYNNTSDGYCFNMGSNRISYDEFVDRVKARANLSDISDTELYIGLTEELNTYVAETVAGKHSKEEINAIAYETYLENELEEVRSNGR